MRTAGDLPAAVEELRTALRLASRSGDGDRAADVRATLGVTLISQGHTNRGLRLLDAAIEQTQDRTLAAKALMRRGACLSWVLGRHKSGLADLDTALSVFEKEHHRAWEARTHGFLGLVHLALGHVPQAERHASAARDQFVALGRSEEAVLALHNQGAVAYVKGDLPTALKVFDRSEEEYAELGIDAAPLAASRSAALLAARLAAEAVTVIEEQLHRGAGLPVQQAELRLLLAKARLAAGDPEKAEEQARAALRAFRRSGRDWFAHQAELVALLAREKSSGIDRRRPRRR